MLQNGNAPPSNGAPASFAGMSGMNTDHYVHAPVGSVHKNQPPKPIFQEERERQASALAAAGMIAESVGVAAPVALQAPPPLATHPGAPSAATDMDWTNGSGQDAAMMQIDDLDLDFATLFDPAYEEQNMNTQGSGWPSSATPTSTTTLEPQNSKV